MSYHDRTPAEWIDEIDKGLEYRRRFGIEDMWGKLEAIYYNVDESRMNDGPNIFLSQGDAMLSTITVPQARVRVKATTPEEVDKAPLVESLDAKLVRDCEVALEVDRSALHAYLWGRGIMKIGYDSEWGFDPTLDVAGNLRFGMTLTQLNRTGSRRIEYDSGITPGHPWCKAVMPHDIVVPWGTTELSTAEWIAHRVVRQVDDLRADRKYSNTKNLRAMMSIQDFFDSYRSVQARKIHQNQSNSIVRNARDADFVEFWEIHDRRTGKIYCVCRDHDKFLRNETNALQIDNQLPFCSLGFVPRTRSFWVTPDAYYLYYVQEELSDVALQRSKQRRISVIKFLYDAGAIEEAELEKILSPDVGAAAKVNTGHELTKVIQKLEVQPNVALANEEELLRANAREQIGFSRNQLGEYQSGRKTASEVSVVERAAQLRMSRRGLNTKRYYQDIIRTINNVVFSYWTMPRYVEAIGQTNAQEFIRVNGPALKGRYDYEIEFTEEAEMQQRKLEALSLYGTLSQDPTVNHAELQQFLKNQVNDPAFSRLFNAPIRSQMPQVPGGQGGGTLSPQPLQRPPQVSRVLNEARQNGQSPATRFLAPRGSGA